MSNTETSSTAYDNLFGVEHPVITEAATVAISQTLARGAAVGKKLVAAGAVANGGAGGSNANTGDGTCTELALVNSRVVPMVGAYTLKFTKVVTHGGDFVVKDPNGMTVANGSMTAGAGANTVFEVDGFSFKLTDGATDFIVGDGFILNIAAGTGQVVALDKSLTDGSQFIYGIMLDAVTTGSGATAVGTVAKTGSFNTDLVTFVSGTTAADVAADARTKGIFFVDGAF